MIQSVRHEFQLLISRPLVFLILIGAASGYALLIGNLYSGETVQNIPIAVCDLEDSALSRELIRNVHDTDQYDYRETLIDEFMAIDKLERGEVTAVLVIPNDFSKRFYTQQAVSLALLQDNSNILQASYALSPMQSVVSNFAEKYYTQAAISNVSLNATNISMSLRMSGNPTQSYLEFYIYGVMLMASQIGILIAFGLSLQDDLKDDIKPNLIAKEIICLCFSMISIMIGMFILATLFNLPFRADISKILLLCAAFYFVVENLSGIATLYFKTSTSLIQCMIFYTLPAFMLSGYTWSEIGMTLPIKMISALQPVHYILIDFRDLALIGESANNLQHTVIFCFSGTVLYFLLYILLKFRLKAI